MGQPVVLVKVDLQSAGQPGWHPHMAQAQFLVHEVKVVVQALTIVRLEKGLARLLSGVEVVESWCDAVVLSLIHLFQALSFAGDS